MTERTFFERHGELGKELLNQLERDDLVGPRLDEIELLVKFELQDETASQVVSSPQVRVKAEKSDQKKRRTTTGQAVRGEEIVRYYHITSRSHLSQRLLEKWS